MFFIKQQLCREISLGMCCEISGSHGGVYEDENFQGYSGV
jgi:hypothetical protein